MEWHKAYADVDKMKQALKDGGCIKKEVEEGFYKEEGWYSVLVKRPWENPNEHFDDYNFFVANYYVSNQGIGFWAGRALICALLSEEQVRDTDMWAIIETPKEKQR